MEDFKFDQYSQGDYQLDVDPSEFPTDGLPSQEEEFNSVHQTTSQHLPESSMHNHMHMSSPSSSHGDQLFDAREHTDLPLSAPRTLTHPEIMNISPELPASIAAAVPQDAPDYLALSKALFEDMKNIDARESSEVSIPHTATESVGSGALEQGNLQDENSWMHNGDADEDEEFIYFNKIVNTLNALKQETGELNSEDALHLMRARKQLATIERMRNGGCHQVGSRERSPEDEEDSLFLPDEGRDSIIEHHRISNLAMSQDLLSDLSDSENDGHQTSRPSPHQSSPDADSLDPTMSALLNQVIKGGKSGESSEPKENGDLGFKKNGEPRKRRAKAAENAREAHEQAQRKKAEKEREKARKKLQKQKERDARKGPIGKAKGKGKGKGKGNVVAKRGKGKLKNGESLLQSSSQWKSKGEDEVAQRMLRDLMDNDDIGARLSDPIFDIEPGPEIKGRQVKSTQFQRLFANIPEGSNKADVKEDKQKLKQAQRAFGHGNVKAVDGRWLVRGMKNPLYHHQLLGVKWMLERELSEDKPHGGVLADSMGLGKTIQTIALMIANPPIEKDIKRKVTATLIVCPATIVNQWISEIDNHAEKKRFPKVLHYKRSMKLPKEILQDVDVVITSYHEVMAEFPFPGPRDREIIQEIGDVAWWKSAYENAGVLHQMNWYRVVLDEAHTIKNNSARTSLACQYLRSIYRWCLTGTPLMNRLEELFPYLRFLKADFTLDWKTFQRYFCDPHNLDCQKRISTVLSYCMFRRTMKTTILGRPIIVLPTPHPKIEHINFSPAEKIIYRITENRFRANINRYLAEGDAARKYGVFLVQLLRLRQITSHPWLIQRTMKECWTLEDIQELRHRLSQLDTTYRDTFYEQTKIWVGETETEKRAAIARGEQHSETLPFGKGDFGHAFNMDHALDTLDEEEMLTRVTCGKCSDFPIPPVKTDCDHVFCLGCLEEVMHQQAVLEEHQGFWICPTCEKMFQNYTPLHAKSRGTDYDDMEGDSGAGSPIYSEMKIYSKGLDMRGFEPQSDTTWVPKSDSTPGFKLAPSVKTATLKAILLKGFHEAPLDKVVIYVQFRTLARIVARICKSEGWGFLYFTGDMSQDDRQKAVTRFREDSEAKILISGLKCGGLGVNLQMANRCISLDLWWNHAVEQQAFGRIFRIGQQKETYMTRIVVKQSVDMRLLTMQVNKLQELKNAIRDDGTSETPRLSLMQLTNLFGFLKTDEDDNIVSVEPDYEDNIEWNQGGAGRIDDEEPAVNTPSN